MCTFHFRKPSSFHSITVTSCLFTGSTRSEILVVRGNILPEHRQRPRNFDPKDVGLWAVGL